MILESKQAAHVVGEAGTPEDLLAVLSRMPCDIVIVDLSLADRQGHDVLAFVERLASSYPSMHLLIITALRSAGLLNAILKRGGGSLIERSADSIVELLHALRLACCGKSYLGKSIKQLMDAADLRPREMAALTVAELEVLRLFAYEGLTSCEISARLGRSRKTVSHHKRSVQAKLGLMTDQELINYCRVNALDSFTCSSGHRCTSDSTA
jgi:two-component system capsular synthesis response regulator RcsB